MSDEQAPAGWYPDPDQPTRQRYWDGTAWTDHYHDPAAPSVTPPPPSGSPLSGSGLAGSGLSGSAPLPSIGQWFGTTFGAIRAYGVPALGLAVGGAILVNLLLWVVVEIAVSDQAHIDEAFIGDIASFVVRGAVGLVVISLAQVIVSLAVSRYMQRAHRQATPTVAEAFARTVRRAPALIGWGLVVLTGSAIAIALVGVVAGLIGPGAAVVALLLLVPALVWLMVKFVFLSTAAVAVPASTSIVRASMQVSAGRFWPVFGRLALLWIGTLVVSSTASSVIGLDGVLIDEATVDRLVVGSGDAMRVLDFTFAELLPSATRWILFAVFNGIISGLMTLVVASALVRLYLDSGAPSDV